MLKCQEFKDSESDKTEPKGSKSQYLDKCNNEKKTA